MPTESSERVRLSIADARALSEGALCGIGFDPEEARIVADHAIDAALCGYEYSGLPKLLNIVDSPHFKSPRRPLSILRETNVSVLFDGGNNVGMLAIYHAARAAIERAQHHGCVFVGVTNSFNESR